MPRPRKSASGETATEQLRARVSPEYKRMVAAAAERAGQSMTDYICGALDMRLLTDAMLPPEWPEIETTRLSDGTYEARSLVGERVRCAIRGTPEAAEARLRERWG